jgi:hypothetical protein
MGAGARDALARGRVSGALRLAAQQWRRMARRCARLAPQEAANARLTPGILGKTRCLWAHRVRGDGQRRFRSRMVDRARIAIAVLIMRDPVLRKAGGLVPRIPFDAS